ncbi:hypothetical protein Bpfe_005528, partial [Biomphalaria pfeifferi]
MFMDGTEAQGQIERASTQVEVCPVRNDNDFVSCILCKNGMFPDIKGLETRLILDHNVEIEWFRQLDTESPMEHSLHKDGNTDKRPI